MILLVYSQTKKLNQLNNVLLSFPESLLNEIQLIYCITPQSKHLKQNPTVLLSKPIFFFPDNALVVNSLIVELQKSLVLTHWRYINISTIFQIFQSLEDYLIFKGKDENNNSQFIEDKKLFIEIVSELRLITGNEKKTNATGTNKSILKDELKRALLSSQQRSIIQFDSSYTEPIPKREILNKLSYGYLREYTTDFVEKVIVSGNKRIKILKGVEYLNAAEQVKLVRLIEKNRSQKFKYRIIINGKIPKFLMDKNYKILKLSSQSNEINNTKETINQSEYFISTLTNIAKRVGVDIILNDITGVIKKNGFKFLLDKVIKYKSLEQILQIIITDNSNTIAIPIRLTDPMFWYRLIYTTRLQKLKKIDDLLENQTAKKNKLINKSKQKIQPTDKLIVNSKLLLMRTFKRIKKNPVNGNIGKRSSFATSDYVVPDLDLKKENFEFRQSKNKWKILYNGHPLTIDPDIRYATKGIHLLKELVENHYGPDKSIDPLKLNEILYSKLPQLATFKEKKNNTEAKKNKNEILKQSNTLLKTPKNKVLNSLRENIKEISKKHIKLNFLKDWHHFVFQVEGCYHKPFTDKFIKFTETQDNNS